MTAVQAGAMAAGSAVHAPSSPHTGQQATQQALLHTACTHCGQAVPAGLLRAEASEQFCCHGCEAAYAIIHSCGLEQYYQLLEEAGDVAIKQRDEGSGRSREYGEFDDPVFRELFCQRLGESQVRTEFLLGGVHCGACLWLLERLPRVRAGVLEARLDLRRSALTVTIDERATSLSEVARVLAKLGYPPHPSRGKGVRDVRRREDRAMMVRMAVAGACAGNIMLLYFALYAGLFQGIEHAHEQLLRYTAMILNTLCLAWPANTFLRSAWAAIRTRTVHVDVPIVLGLYLGGIWGIWKTFAGAGDLYFDSISALVFFLLVGRF
jgi:Cu2+-exporting ATPase